MRDLELLEQYLRDKSEPAFEELVNRYANLAYSVAFRQLRDRHLAEEAVQLVFCLLGKKASGLMGYKNLAGWIYRATYNISLKTLREERTRRDREHAFADMEDQTAANDSEQRGEQLSPLLDQALSQLPDTDRLVLVLRFLERKAMREIGEVLGTSEAAAKMRVGRAVEKLRGFFQKRGVSCSSASLAGALAALSVEAAPAGFSAGVLKAALLDGSSQTVPVLALAKTALLMAKMKTKLALLGLGTAALLFTGNYLSDSVLRSTLRQDQPNERAPSNDVEAKATQPELGGFQALKQRIAARLRDAALARAAAELRTALNAPPRKGTRSYPSKDMEEAIAAFGVHQDAAFPILRDALQGESEEAKLQAIAALGRIGKQVPEAKPLLWEVLQSDEGSARFTALGALGNIGFLPEEISILAGMIPGQTDQLLVRYLPEEIARAIKRDPEAMRPHLNSVEALLAHDDPGVRFSAACALAELRGNDPEILSGLASGLAVSENTAFGTKRLMKLSDISWRSKHCSELGLRPKRFFPSFTRLQIPRRIRCFET